MTAERFRKHEHLRTAAEFDRVFAARCSASNDVMVVYTAPNDRDVTRLGISVGKRVGRAVDRAYARRRIREAFRRNKGEFPQGVDIVCVARPGAKDRKVDVVNALIELTAQSQRRWSERSRRRRTPPPSSDRSEKSTDRSP